MRAAMVVKRSHWPRRKGGYHILGLSLLLVTCTNTSVAAAVEACDERESPGCSNGPANSGNSLLQKVSRKSRVHVDATAVEEAQSTSTVLLDVNGGKEAKGHGAGGKGNATGGEEGAARRAAGAERSAAGAQAHHKWATTAMLLAKMVGRQVHGRLLAAAGTTTGAAMFSVAAFMCVVVLTAFLFMQAPGNFTDKEHHSCADDGTLIHDGSPHPVAARPRFLGPRNGSGNQASFIRPHSSPSPPPTATQLRVDSRQGGYYAGLHMPYSAGATPLSTSMSLISRDSPRQSPAMRATFPQSPATTQRSLAGVPPPMYPMSGPASKGLCPGLVVPPNSECVLTVRSLSNLNRGSSAHAPESHRLDVVDLQGTPVMRAHVVRPWPRDPGGFKQRAPVATLCTIDPSGVKEDRLTFCRAGGEGGGRRSMYIYDKDDVLFGCIKCDVTRPRYVLTSSRGGLQLLFEGDFLRHQVSVLNDSRDMLSQCEPAEQHNYQVRVAAGADVGLIISGLLSIDAMETM